MTTLLDMPIDILDQVCPDYLKLLNAVQRNKWIKDTYGTECCDEEDAIRIIEKCSPLGNVYCLVSIADEYREMNTPSFTTMFGNGFTYNEICLAVKYGTYGMVRVVDYRV